MKKSKKNTPIAYRAGVCYFCETPFFVNKNVLIPRFDTEILVENVITKTAPSAGKNPTVLDLCTGSGCVAIILAKHDFEVVATDTSRRALRVAKKNARLNDVDVEFMHADLFDSRALNGKKFDIITCNPPYIKTYEIGKHDSGILHEPRLALDGGADGLDFYRRIAEQAGEYLNDGGELFLEIGYNQGTDVENILHAHGFRDIKIVKDRQGLDRVIVCTKN